MSSNTRITFKEGLTMIRNWLRNFMIGRYGPDHLYVALLVVTIVFMLLSLLTGWWVFRVLAYLALGYALFRMLSKNLNARRKENDKILKFWWPVKTRCKNQIDKFKNRKSYSYFKCPACKNNLRVPRGKGTIQITCPKCGERFIKKT